MLETETRDQSCPFANEVAVLGFGTSRQAVRRLQKEWEVLIRDHHEGYISWEDYENNQRTINGNANMKGEMVPGSVRNGGGLLDLADRRQQSAS